jgi:hypothetical protein
VKRPSNHPALPAPPSTQNAPAALNATQRLPPEAVSGLLRLLAEEDRPVDLLTVLTALTEDYATIPADALAVRGRLGGRSSVAELLTTPFVNCRPLERFLYALPLTRSPRPPRSPTAPPPPHPPSPTSRGARC